MPLVVASPLQLQLPQVVCGFLVAGIRDKYLTWEFIRTTADKYITDKDRFVGVLLNALFTELGAGAPSAWRDAGVTFADLGIKDEVAFVKEHDLGKLFPGEELGKLIAGLIADGASDADVIEKVEATAKELECAVDRDVSRLVLRLVLEKTVADLGGADELQKSDGEKLIEDREKEALSKRAMLLKKWLDKESDQAYALFEVQKLSQEMGYPNGELVDGGWL